MKTFWITAFILLVLVSWGIVEVKTLRDLEGASRTPDVPVLNFLSGEASGGGEATFTYRQGTERRGVVESGSLPLSLEKKWETEPLNVGIHAASKASPAVDETGLYIGGDSGWFSRFSLDGKLQWRFRVDESAFGIHGTALLDQEYVYFGAYNGSFYCLRKKDGSVVWITRLGDAIGSSPVLDGDALFVSSETGFGTGYRRSTAMFYYPSRNGRLAKLDRLTGKTLWQTDWLGEQIHSSPTLFAGGKKVGVGANNGYYFAFDAQDGRLLWSTPVRGAVKGAAAADANERLFFGTYAKTFVALDGKDGHLIWEAPLLGISQTSPALVPDQPIVLTATHENGEIVALHRDSGKALWRHPSQNTLSRSSPLLIRESERGPWRAWMMCEGMFLCALRPDDGKVLRKWPLGSVLTGSPAFFQGALYISINDGGLIKFAEK